MTTATLTKPGMQRADPLPKPIVEKGLEREVIGDITKQNPLMRTFQVRIYYGEGLMAKPQRGSINQVYIFYTPSMKLVKSSFETHLQESNIYFEQPSKLEHLAIYDFSRSYERVNEILKAIQEQFLP